MKKRHSLIIITIILVASAIMCFGCGKQVSQKVTELEAGQSYTLEELFEVPDGYSISAKEAEYRVFMADNDHKLYEDDELTKNITITIKSPSGKEYEKEYSFKVVDTTAPLIKAEAVSVYVGTDLDVSRYLTFADTGMPEMQPVSNADFMSKYGGNVVIDTDAVDISKEGTYDVKVTATDASGNSGTITVQVKVVSSPFVGEWKVTDMLNETGHCSIKADGTFTLDVKQFDGTRTATWEQYGENKIRIDMNDNDEWIASMYAGENNNHMNILVYGGVGEAGGFDCVRIK